MAGISSHPVLRQAPSRSAFFCFFSVLLSVFGFLGSFSLSVCSFFCFFCLFVLPFLLRSSVYSPFPSVRSSVLGSSICPFFRFFSVILSVFGFCSFSLSVCPFFRFFFVPLFILPFRLSVLLSVFGDTFSATQEFCVKLLRRGSNNTLLSDFLSRRTTFRQNSCVVEKHKKINFSFLCFYLHDC